MRQYKTYKEADKNPPYFRQGFVLGAVSGAIGALVILGRYNRPVVTTVTTTVNGVTKVVIEPESDAPPAPPRVTGVESAPQPKDTNNAATSSDRKKVAEG